MIQFFADAIGQAFVFACAASLAAAFLAVFTECRNRKR